MGNKSISFHDSGMPGVLSGKKTETLRDLGEDNFEVDDRVQLQRQDGEVLGFIRILEKDYVAFGNLKEHDARTHGWDTVDILKQRLRMFYPDISDDTILVKYKFKYLEKAPV